MKDINFHKVLFYGTYLSKFTTLGAETFANFANFVQIRESLRREKFYIDPFAKVYARNIFQFFFNALIFVSWRKKGRRQCNTKKRSASIAT